MWLVLLYSFNGYLLYSSLMLKKLDFLDPYLTFKNAYNFH